MTLNSPFALTQKNGYCEEQKVDANNRDCVFCIVHG